MALKAEEPHTPLLIHAHPTRRETCELAGRDWFAGALFSAADIQMSYPIEAAASRAGLGAKLPRLKAFVDRIQTRPAYQRALAEKALAHAGTVMPGFTHLQTAQPVTFGHHLLAYVEMAARDRG